ncbi:MAG: muconate cycloisomerase, partial [Pseudomonas sp.]|nr:muconate cycloisomerase [Pseudomonas sp.]
MEPRKNGGQNRAKQAKNLTGIDMHASAIESIETIIVDLPTIRP